jgi:hypothetical protein
MKVKYYDKKSGVQSARRMHSVPTKDEKFSKTHFIIPNDQNNKTMNTLDRKMKKPRRSVGNHTVGLDYLDYRKNSIASSKRISQDSISKKGKFNSSSKMMGTYSVMEFEGKEFKQLMLRRKKKVSNTNLRPWNATPNTLNDPWLHKKPSENENNMNIVEILDKKRQDLYKKLLKNKKEQLTPNEIVRILKKELRKKKKNILGIIQDNRSLEYKWRDQNNKLQKLHKSKIENFEYLKKLILRDKNQLNPSEMSLVSNINNASKPQIKFEISKILSHETEFVSFDQAEITNSNIHLDSNQNPPKKVEKKTDALTRIYTD